jgi:putative membrane protein
MELNSPRAKFLLYLKGVAMGLGDSVPGISGGTIAVITNIYDQLIFSIRAFDLRACHLLTSAQFRAVWQHINGTFLLLLALGILSGLLASANTVLYLLENYFPALMAFFIGMVLASTWLLRREYSLAAWQNIIALLLGVLLTVSIGFVSPRSVEFSLFYLFLSGVIAISAMILPGLSGAFILLLLGVYEFILNALISFDLPVILVFVSGCVLGLLAFSRVLAWVLVGHHQLSYAFIAGMLLGSISALWPWQHANEPPMLLVSAITIVLGVAVVVLLHLAFAARSVKNSD